MYLLTVRSGVGSRASVSDVLLSFSSKINFYINVHEIFQLIGNECQRVWSGPAAESSAHGGGMWSSPAVKLRRPNVSSVVSYVVPCCWRPRVWLTLCCTNPRIPAPLDTPTATITKKLLREEQITTWSVKSVTHFQQKIWLWFATDYFDIKGIVRKNDLCSSVIIYLLVTNQETKCKIK